MTARADVRDDVFQATRAALQQRARSLRAALAGFAFPGVLCPLHAGTRRCYYPPRPRRMHRRDAFHPLDPPQRRLGRLGRLSRLARVSFTSSNPAPDCTAYRIFSRMVLVRL